MDKGLCSTKATIIKNYRKPRDHKNQIFKKMFDNVKANGSHITPRFQGTSSKKLSTTKFTRRMTFSTTKDRMHAIEDCTDTKARPSIEEGVGVEPIPKVLG